MNLWAIWWAISCNMVGNSCRVPFIPTGGKLFYPPSHRSITSQRNLADRSVLVHVGVIPRSLCLSPLFREGAAGPKRAASRTEEATP